jgi:hypothetical protein
MAVGADPPQGAPVVVVVVGEQGDGRVGGDVGQAAEAKGRLGLGVVDGGVDGVGRDGEDDRDEVRAGVGAGGREAGDARRGEALPGFRLEHGATVAARRAGSARAQSR